MEFNAQLIDLEGGLLIGIVRTTDFGYCLFVAIARTIDLEGGLLIGIVGAIDLGYGGVVPTIYFQLEECPLIGIVRTIDYGDCL